jgi:hypothetical protein
MLTDAELLARQERLQAEARDFLELHRVEPSLARADRVVLIGSYVTGLMVWRDLDVCVDARGLTRERAWELVWPLIRSAENVRYEHWHESDGRRHYFVLRLDDWKLDLSLFTDGMPPDVEAFQEDLCSRLDDEMRLVILRLKEAWHTRPEYPYTIGGFEIYSAVLDGVRTEEEFERHVRGA